MRKQSGFSLMELLIVVAMILIITAIAVPSLLRARIKANESSAVQSMRNIVTAEHSYQTAYPQYGFAPSLKILGPNGGPACPAGPVPTTGACLLDSVLGGAPISAKSGYMFQSKGASPGPPDPATGIAALTEYTASASPFIFNQTGVRVFCVGNDGTLRQNPNTGGAFSGAQDFSPWAIACSAVPWTVLE